MSELQCRLCSARDSLISLFSGKSRKIRDNIRKVVEITTGIGFQEGDVYHRICLTCAIQSYNFYVFQTRCFENETRLQEASKYFDKPAKKKVSILGLDEIEIPDLDVLKEKVAPWLMTKQNRHRSLESEQETSEYAESSDSVSNIQKTIDANNVSSKKNDVKVRYNGIQKNNVNSSIQCTVKCKECMRREKTELKNKTTQCDRAQVEHKENQCQISVQSDHKQIQCNMNVLTLNNGITNNKLVQCEIINCHQLKICTDDRKSPQDCLINFKKEKLSPLLSPTKSLHITDDDTIKPENFRSSSSSPMIPRHSPTIDNSELIRARKKVGYVKICGRCDHVMYSKLEVRKHRRIHMRCPLCKKTFNSIRDTVIHNREQCDVKFKSKPVVEIVRMNMGKKPYKTRQASSYENVLSDDSDIVPFKKIRQNYIDSS